MRKLPFYLLLPFFFNYSPLQAQLPAGKVIDTIQCSGDSSFSYSLYLPAGYPERDNWPIVYVFDPEARGSHAVGLFSEAAEKYGFVIAGSNNARNGPWDPIYASADAMFKDTYEKLSVDRERLYLAGFSGGSRAASSIAMITGRFAGVIGCGAGFSPGYPPNFDIDFDFIGLIGNRDFNYQEMMNLDRWLKTFDVDHETLEFEGGHNWPPAGAIDKALLWMKIRSMDKHYKYMDYYLLFEFREEYEKTGKQFVEEKKFYEAFRNYQFMVTALRGVKEVDQYELLMYEIMQEPDFRKEIKIRQKNNEIEQTHLKQYKNAFRAYRSVDYEPGVEIQPMRWWKKQVKIANKYIKKAKTHQDTLLGERLLDYIWRTAYIQYEAVLNSDESVLVPIYLEIWSLARPEWPAPHYLASRYYAANLEINKAVDELEYAIEKGYSDFDAMKNDTLLHPLLDDRKFKKLTTPPDTASGR